MLPAAGSAGRLAATASSGLNLDTGKGWANVSNGVFNVQCFGAVGDGSTDETPAFQAALDAACAANGIVVVPPPAANRCYLFRNSLRIVPPSGQTQVRLRIQAMGSYQAWQYAGKDAAFISLSGCKECVFDNINVLFQNNVHDAICWDSQPKDAIPSMNNVRWSNCRVFFGTGGNNIAWRTGQASPSIGYSDQADFLWDNCEILGGGAGDMGWQICGPNTCPSTFFHCSGSNLYQMFSTAPRYTLTTAAIQASDTTIFVQSTLGFPPVGVLQIQGELIAYTSCTSTSFAGCTRGYNGTTPIACQSGGYLAYLYLTDPLEGVLAPTADISWYGGGGSDNLGDFLLVGGGKHDIIGYRGENGQRFLQTGLGGHSYSILVNVQSCDLAAYTQPAGNGACILLTGSDGLTLRNCNLAENAASFDARFIAVEGGNAFLDLSNSCINGSDPFYTASASTKVSVKNIQLCPNGGGVTGFAKER